MNPQTVKKPHDRQKIYNEYIASLQAQTQLLDRTAQAVSVLKTTGQPPQQPTDMRTMTQKALDIDGQKIAVRRLLHSVTDGQQVSSIMDALNEGEITFLSWSYADIFSQLKSKYAAGVPAPIFIEYLRRYMMDYSKNLGVKQGLQNARSDELMMSMREIIDSLPTPQTIAELIHTIRSIPDDLANAQLKQQTLQAVAGLASAVPTTGMATQAAGLDPTALNQVTSLMNGGFENAPSNQQTQKMSNSVNRAISSHSQGQVNDVLADLLDTFKMERDDFDKIEQAKAIATNKKAAFDTAQPARASAIESKAVASAPRKLRANQLPTRELLDDYAYIESPEIDMREIEDKYDVATLRKWMSLKIAAGDFPSVNGVNNLKKPELLGLVDDYKTNNSEFSQRAKDYYAPAPKAPKKVAQKQAPSPLKQPLVIPAAKAGSNEFDVNMTEQEFEKESVESKYAILLDMIDKQIPEHTLRKATLTKFTAMIDKNDKNDEGDYNKYYDTMLKKVKPVGGHGISKGKKIAFGCGFAKPSMKIEVNNIDFDAGVKREATYIPLGRYFVNRHKLGDNKLMIKTIKGGAVHGLPTLTISPKLSKMIHKIVTGKGFPSHNELCCLDDDDKDILHKIFKLSQAEGIESIPAPSKSRDEQELNRFTILRGELCAGNDSKELVKEFKVLLLKMMNENKIPKHAGREILVDLVSLGY